MEVLVVFLLKLIDNSLGTFKSIFMIRDKYLYASIFSALATTVYTLAVVKIARSNDPWTLVAVCAATFIGTLVPGIVYKKSERERLYIYDITSDTLDAGKAFTHTLRENNIATKTSVVYDKHMKQTLSIKAYCMTKEESKFINEIIPAEFKYNVYIPEEVSQSYNS